MNDYHKPFTFSREFNWTFNKKKSIASFTFRLSVEIFRVETFSGLDLTNKKKMKPSIMRNSLSLLKIKNRLKFHEKVVLVFFWFF